MKFKTIFIIFNTVIIFSFLFIFLMPLFILGTEYAFLFWSQNWYLALLFLVVIIVLNSYFAKNWKLFSLLEQEDWPHLQDFLEQKIYNQKRIRNQYVRLLINTYIVTSSLAGISRLETFLREHKPKLVKRYALSLGMPYLLKNEAKKTQEYFGEFLHGKGVKNLGWIKWNYSFALILQNKTEEAKDYLLSVLESTNDHVLFLLTAYMLDAFSSSDETIRQEVSKARELIQDKYTPAGLEREVEKHRENIQVVILSKLIQDAADWVFSEWNPDKKASNVSDIQPEGPVQ
ncbi:MAG: hypothetical protein ACLFR1_07485 [Spirochaetia bacterium]